MKTETSSYGKGMQPMSKASQSRIESTTSVIVTYPPSWYERLQNLVDRLPIPYWVTYTLLGLTIFGVGALVKVFDPLQSGTPLDPTSLLAIFQIAYVLTLMHFLDRLSARSFEVLRPILELGEPDKETLKARLTTMPPRIPSRIAILVCAFFTCIGVLLFTGILSIENPDLSLSVNQFSNSPVGILNWIYFTLLWVVNAIFIYHTFHQLRTISTILTQHARINLFHQNELYAFSRVSASTAIGLVLTSPIWLLLDRGLINLIINSVFSIMALIIFVTPLVGAHALLKRQKDQLLKQCQHNKEVLINDLFIKLEQGKLKEIQLIEGALSGLDKAHNDIHKISTWPWQMGTVRQIIGAISLPITIWLIQYFLSGFLSP
jgi:hypothetical protein